MSDDLRVVFTAQVDGEGQYAELTYHAFVQRGELAGMRVSGAYRRSIEEAAEGMAHLLGCGIVDGSHPAVKEHARRKANPVPQPWVVLMATMENVTVMAISQEEALERAQDLPKKEWRQASVNLTARPVTRGDDTA